MSQTLQEILDLANEAAELGPDFGEVIAGGGGRLLPEGKALARLVSVIEYGDQPQEYNGKAKAPAPVYRLGFALFNQGMCNDDGTPYFIETFDLTQSNNEKASSLLFFKKLNYKGTAKHPSQLIGQLFLLNIKHHVAKSAPAGTKPRSVIDLKFCEPACDPLNGNPYACPDAPAEMYRFFSWNKPTLAAWDKLFIEGEHEGKSKNWIQETIVGATNFAGSPLEALLLTNTRAIPKAREKVKPAAPAGAIPLAAQPVGAVPGATPLAQAAAPVPTAAAPVALAAVAPVTVAATPAAVPVAVAAVATPVAPVAVTAPVVQAAAPVQVEAPFEATHVAGVAIAPVAVATPVLPTVASTPVV